MCCPECQILPLSGKSSVPLALCRQNLVDIRQAFARPVVAVEIGDRLLISLFWPYQVA